MTFAVVLAADVAPSSVRLTVNGRDASGLLGTLTPGTTKMLVVPLDGMRTVVRLRAAATSGGVDTDRFVIRRKGPAS